MFQAKSLDYASDGNVYSSRYARKRNLKFEIEVGGIFGRVEEKVDFICVFALLWTLGDVEYLTSESALVDLKSNLERFEYTH